LLVVFAAAAAAFSAEVTPIDWSRFAPARTSLDLYQARHILQTATRYNLAWLPGAWKENAAGDAYLPPNMDEHGIRPGASILYGAAVLLKTGNYDEAAVGLPEGETVSRLRKLARGLAASHKVNAPGGKGWGDQWQSAHWASLMGQGAWMLWDDLDAGTRGMVQRAVEHEADRFIAPGYAVPYWTAPDGHVNSPGDTKAEENSWNAMILQLAVAMMPDHPHAEAWKRVGSELMVSAFALKSDLDNSTMVDGKPVKDWLHGFNVRDDGAVINHGIIHPDYTATPTLQLRAYLTQSLAGQPIPQSAAFNAPFIYRSFSLHSWPSPPYEAPGGPMYIPHHAEVYYPQGTDWSRYRFDIYYLFDAFADVLGWDHGLKDTARTYMRLRAARLLAMQARHPDGHAWTPSEAKGAYPNDSMLAWQMGDACLLLWLKGRHAISPVGNWLARR
jgi:hypothetical protein